MFALLAGVSYPALIYILGITFNDFIDYAVVDSIKSGDYSQIYAVISDNYTQANYSYFCDIRKQSNLRKYFFSDDPEGRLQDRITTYAYYTIGISLVFFVCIALSRFLWTFSAARQARSMRLNYLKSVLTRHVGWFDINPSTELPTHLSQ